MTEGIAPISPKKALSAVEQYHMTELLLLGNSFPSDFNLGKQEAHVKALKALETLMLRAKVKPNKGARTHCKALSENE